MLAGHRLSSVSSMSGSAALIETRGTLTPFTCSHRQDSYSAPKLMGILRCY